MEKPTEQRADERGADSVQRPCSAINPEWTSLENKPHLIPAICHPDAATIVRAAAEPRGNYDLGRKHAKGEVEEMTVEPMKTAIKELLLAASKLRIRVNHFAPNTQDQP